MKIILAALAALALAGCTTPLEKTYAGRAAVEAYGAGVPETEILHRATMWCEGAANDSEECRVAWNIASGRCIELNDAAACAWRAEFRSEMSQSYRQAYLPRPTTVVIVE